MAWGGVGRGGVGQGGWRRRFRSGGVEGTQDQQEHKLQRQAPQRCHPKNNRTNWPRSGHAKQVEADGNMPVTKNEHTYNIAPETPRSSCQQPKAFLPRRFFRGLVWAHSRNMARLGDITLMFRRHDQGVTPSRAPERLAPWFEGPGPTPPSGL